jgi:nickel-dependent lactate racemase
VNNPVQSRTGAWHGDREVAYSFPERWTIEVFSPTPHQAIDPKALYAKIRNPIGCAPLSSYLRPGARVCIVSDDILRPTRTDLIIPVLLQLLRENGVDNARVQIVVASGTHGKMSQAEKRSKFGREVCDSVRIIDHDCRRRLRYRGRTSLGTEVYVNRHVAESDLVIGVGGIYAALQPGFGGGAKLILGVCGFKTIRDFHRLRRGVERGGPIDNPFRKDVSEAARLCGLKFIVNNLLSQDREIIDLFAGDPQEAFRAGVEKAKLIYAAPDPKERPLDMVVAEAYPFDGSCIAARKAWWPLTQCRPHCHRLLISDIPSGVGAHGLFPLAPDPRQKLTAWLKRFSQWTRRLRTGAPVTKKDATLPFAFPLVICHSLEKHPRLADPNIRFINRLAPYFRSVAATSAQRRFRVGFYRAASLLYPSS